MLHSMRRTAELTVILLVAIACGGATTATQPPTTTTLAKPATTTTVATTTTTVATTTTTEAESGAQFAITSLSLGENGMVVITNIGTEAGSLSGYFLCQRPDYFALPAVTLEPGEFFAISTGGDVFLPPPGAVTTDQIATIGLLSPTGGEVGLYSSSNFNSPADIVSYVEWGNAGHGRSSVAINAGIWPADSFVQTGADTAGLFANTVPPTEPAHWDAFSG
jgi:hypothetical protein